VLVVVVVAVWPVECIELVKSPHYSWARGNKGRKAAQQTELHENEKLFFVGILEYLTFEILT